MVKNIEDLNVNTLKRNLHIVIVVFLFGLLSSCPAIEPILGGIAAALRLKAKNHQVVLVEKHNDLGGRARVFKKNGFTFDGGPTVITAPYLLDELFNLLSKK